MGSFHIDNIIQYQSLGIFGRPSKLDLEGYIYYILIYI